MRRLSLRRGILVAAAAAAALAVWAWLSSAEDWETIREAYRVRVEESVRRERGSGCSVPRFSPFHPEIQQFEARPPEPVDCGAADWVKCRLSKCNLTETVLSLMPDTVCTYRELVYQGDDRRALAGPPAAVAGAADYGLQRSDHVQVSCRGTLDGIESKWNGWATGFRPVKKVPPPGREHTPNVLIISFDSVSRNKFIRKMPKSYKFLTEEFNATIFNKYHVVDDGTLSALIALLTGKHYYEMPDCRRGVTKTHVDNYPFIFKKLHEDGYRTAYLEDAPWIYTFTWRLNGFQRPPTDHYLFPFFKEYYSHGDHRDLHRRICVGDTPVHQLMLDLADQFTQLEGKKLMMLHSVQASHDCFAQHQLALADAPLTQLLRTLVARGALADTLVIVMSDHGSKHGNIRTTYFGKIEERLPFLAIRLPDALVQTRPEAQEALGSNVDSLVTAYDVHASLLDVVGLPHLISNHKIGISDLPRSISLLTQIPSNRSCGEAGITPYWCACARWEPVPRGDAMFQRAAHALTRHVNEITRPLRSKCAERSLTGISWVRRGAARELRFATPRRFYHLWRSWKTVNTVPYLIMVSMSPGEAVFEACVTHLVAEDQLAVDAAEISRVSQYGHEPDCINTTFPHLNPFCYCVY